MESSDFSLVGRILFVGKAKITYLNLYAHYSAHTESKTFVLDSFEA